MLGGVLPHAVTAWYNCNEKLQSCHKGTRADVLAQVSEWVAHTDTDIEGNNSDASKLYTARVFWINGPGSAGTGKSTIAYTVAEDLDSQHKLGASFFCSRDSSDCSNPKLIFSTIAYQLGRFCPAFQDEITAVLKASPDEAFSIVSRQLEQLLVKPLCAMKQKMPPCVVVIDALDECQDGGATSVILSALAGFITDLFPVKFLITSRPEPHIMNAFRVTHLDQVTQRYILHQVEPKVVEADLQIYLTDSLQTIRAMYELDEGWPSLQDVKTLACLSSGLFIFAATAIKFIQENSDPQGQLASILYMLSAKESSHTLLDQLYLQVLRNAFPNISAEFSSRLRLILGSIVLLRNPLSISNLNRLLNVSVPLHITLRNLQSVVIVPESEEKAVQLIHPTFYEFLVTPGRCIEPKYLVQCDLQHTFLAQSCLDVMCILVKDICKTGRPWKLDRELENMPSLVQQNIPQFLQYACRNWSQHLSQGLLSDTVLEKLQTFCHKYLLFWVEVCSLLGDLHGALDALKLAHTHLSVSKCSSLLMIFLCLYKIKDCGRSFKSCVFNL